MIAERVAMRSGIGGGAFYATKHIKAFLEWK